MKEIITRIGCIDDIYEALVQEFPPNELKSYKEFLALEAGECYEVVLAFDQELIGYALVYKSEEKKKLWLDFLAILPQFQSKGYGSIFFNAIMKQYTPEYTGMYLEVEVPEKNQPNQQRRIAFYERQGVELLPMRYWLPTEEGGFPMYLMYRGEEKVTRQETCLMIEEVFAYLHKNVPDMPHILKKIKSEDENKMKKINTPLAPAAIGPYSQAVTYNNMIYTSGQIPMNPENSQLVEGDITQQAEQVMKNIKAVLQAAGGSLDTVLKTTCFLKNMDDFEKFNAVYSQYFTNKPARSCVAVKTLPKDVLCEVEAIAIQSDCE